MFSWRISMVSGGFDGGISRKLKSIFAREFS